MDSGKAGSNSGSDRGLRSEEVIPAGRRLGRYEVLRHVGAGGMGVVYQARDTRSGNIVALKTLHRMEPGPLLRLKNEFRFIADVTHRNLVSLHELVSADDQWFFTMEYIEGENLWSLLQRSAQGLGESAQSRPSSETVTSAGRRASEETVTSAGRQASEDTVTSAGRQASEDTVTSDHMARSSPAGLPPAQPMGGLPRPLLPVDQLRRIFRELALGIIALHSARKLHCDIKPRNVMIANDGRVVLLDFGLSSDRAVPSASDLAGTPAYISPEQVMGQPASEASDWYAFGVMLYEALTGNQAFPRGRTLRDKAAMEVQPIPPSPFVPEDLRDLCMALLARDPEARPSGREVLERLGGSEDAPAARMLRARGLIGREEQLAALRDAYQAMLGGRTVAVHVHGPSGMGKTALVHRFFELLGEHGQATVLSGRCYERESVPYKAFDSLVDSLTRHLRSLPSREVEALVPQDASELVRIFPVLRQVGAFERVEPSRLEAVRDQHELRRRAFRAFKDLLARLGRRSPLVLYIDDLQWGDQDSTIALGELLDPPEAPRLLLLCSYRTGEGESAGLLEAHRRRTAALADPLDVREVVIGPLTEQQSSQLAAAMLGSDEADPRAIGIAREAHGSPFFVEELVRYTLSPGTRPAMKPEEATLERVVLARVGQLPEGTRRLLEVVAVAGQPVAQGTALEAAALQGDRHAPWTALRSANLVRTRGPRDEDPVECYHDRIREIVHGSLLAEGLQAHHLRLANLFEQGGGADPELLARHFRGGGVRDKAGRYAALAGDRAASALAFERAAELYRSALECLPGDAALIEKRADALVNTGRCAEAAPLYQEAAKSAAPERAFRLRLRTAEQFLAAGLLPEGMSVLKPVLAEVGLPHPATPKQALLRIIGRSIQLQVGGFRFRERPVEEIPPELIKQMDVAWGAAKGLGSVDIMRGGYFSVRSTQLALRAGDARRIARGLLTHGMVTLARGTPREVKNGTRLLEDGERMCARLGEPYLAGLARIVRGTAEMALGRWRSADQALQEGMRILDDRCTGVAWEYSQGYSCDVYSLQMLGELREMASRGSRWLRISEENGDRYGRVGLLIHTSCALLAADDPAAAAEQNRRGIAGWSPDVFTPQHLWSVVEAATCDLYRGDAPAAWTHLDDAWKVAEDAYALGWQFCRVYATQVRAGVAVALARVRPGDRDRLLAVAERDARRLEREGPHYARGAAALVRGAVAATRGRSEEALRALDGAISGFTEAEMALYAACARRRKGELLGGEEGRSLIESADAALRAQGIRDVARWTAMYAPGYSGP